MVVRLLSQTRPIPRSPDGDNNGKSYPKAQLEDPEHVRVGLGHPLLSAVADDDKRVDDLADLELGYDLCDVLSVSSFGVVESFDNMFKRNTSEAFEQNSMFKHANCKARHIQCYKRITLGFLNHFEICRFDAWSKISNYFQACSII